MLQGKVYLVCASPGDLKLITFKGYQLICQVDVILHDHLISPAHRDFTSNVAIVTGRQPTLNEAKKNSIHAEILP
ncbi:MAG: SAM-dependent methyltransferase [Phycisphaerae bacterium]